MEQKPLRFFAGESLFIAGEAGQAMRLDRGVVRLNHAPPSADEFAGLAMTGDLLGCETLLFGAYTFTAIALTPCQLTPWPPAGSAMNTRLLLNSFTELQSRTADLLALRGGAAIDRILKLIDLLKDEVGQVILPLRQEIAQITDLRLETVSRIIKSLEASGTLTPHAIPGIASRYGFRLG